MTAAEALRRYHAAETRLAEVEKLIEAHDAYQDWLDDGGSGGTGPDTMPIPEGDLQALYLERERLQAESFKVFTEARRLG